MYFHPSYLILIPGMLLVWWAQSRVQGTYHKYAQIPSSMGMTGAQVAETILQRMGVQGVTVEPVAGQLTDHYDPTAKVVRLSESVYDSNSLAAAAVAAHECGHVLQDVQEYKFMNLGPMLIMAGLFLASFGMFSTIFIQIGIVLFATVIAFHIVTLPVEFDASSRALKLIDQLGILQGDENKAAKKVLNAAALTYVATALYALLQLAQYLLILFSRRD
jgi:uncharacterized protein